MARIHLIIGPVGAGKSTFARQLCQKHRGVHLNLDEWMARLFRPDRPDEGVIEWYVERTGRCIEQIWTLTQGLMDVGTDAVLEIGMIRRGDREWLYSRMDVTDHDVTIYVLDAPRALRRERVQHRNLEQGETFSMEVPPHIFDMASDMWEPPDEAESSGRDMRFISTDG